MALKDWANPIASGIGGIAQGIFGSIAAKKQRKFQKQMQLEQWQNDLSMWNRQNEYNSPASQRKRLEEAGLNPALMYGSAPQNVSTTLPKYGSRETPVYKFDPSNILSMLGQIVSIKAGMEDVKTKNLSNSFLNTKLLQEQGLRFIQGQKGYFDIGKGDSEVSNSPYGRKSSSEINRILQENELRTYQVNFMKNIPKEYQWLAPLFMELLRIGNTRK